MTATDNTNAPIPAFPCPRCGKPSQWANNPSRPFCSERCKLIDLGAWANEDYRVPEKNTFTKDTQDSDFEED